MFSDLIYALNIRDCMCRENRDLQIRLVSAILIRILIALEWIELHFEIRNFIHGSDSGHLIAGQHSNRDVQDG